MIYLEKLKKKYPLYNDNLDYMIDYFINRYKFNKSNRNNVVDEMTFYFNKYPNELHNIQQIIKYDLDLNIDRFNKKMKSFWIEKYGDIIHSLYCNGNDLETIRITIENLILNNSNFDKTIEIMIDKELIEVPFQITEDEIIKYM